VGKKRGKKHCAEGGVAICHEFTRVRERFKLANIEGGRSWAPGRLNVQRCHSVRRKRLESGGKIFRPRGVQKGPAERGRNKKVWGVLPEEPSKKRAPANL